MGGSLKAAIIFPYITLILLSYSCSSITVYNPSSRFMTSESTGRTFAGAGSFGSNGGTQATISLENGKINNEVKLRNNVSPLTGAFEMGIIKQLDFFTKTNINSPSLTGLKYQIYGESRAKADEGNTSIAISIAAGGQSKEAQSNTIFFSSDIEKYSVHHNVTDFSIMGGHRFDKDILTYASIQYTRNTVKIELESTDMSLHGKNFIIENNTIGYSLGVVRYWKTYFLNAELSAQINRWSHSDQMTFAFVNLNMGWKWN